MPGFEAYASYFARTATSLNPCAPGASPKLAGPGWGNVNTIDAAWLAMQAKAAGARCYMRELSVHVRLCVLPLSVCVLSLGHKLWSLGHALLHARAQHALDCVQCVQFGRQLRAHRQLLPFRASQP